MPKSGAVYGADFFSAKYCAINLLKLYSTMIANRTWSASALFYTRRFNRGTYCIFCEQNIFHICAISDGPNIAKIT